MSNTFRNFVNMNLDLQDDDDWNESKSVRKHVVKQQRLQTRQKLRNMKDNYMELDEEFMEDF